MYSECVHIREYLVSLIRMHISFVTVCVIPYSKIGRKAQRRKEFPFSLKLVGCIVRGYDTLSKSEKTTAACDQNAESDLQSDHLEKSGLQHS